MSIDTQVLAQLLVKKANDSGKPITEQEAIEIANDNFYSEVFSVQSPSPKFDERLSELIEQHWSKRGGR